ncbi:NUDIX hydrolase [Clostridium sp. ATCC 25772]|uniref:NUDIX hydrolase n=1 Tax=Clostridium sp. ATCC 25772 TaxID=1676991 RepID=UPI0007828C45|nr:NUDIX hydrolase [Clostridium sp. ATCC 25772]
MNFPTHIVAVAGLITNDDEKILLVKNPISGWEFPGGQVENGENLIEALKREIEEESGAIANIDSLVGVYSNVQSYMGWDGVSYTPTKVILDFIGRYVGGDLHTSDESIEVGWFEKENVLQIIENENLKDRARDMLEFHGKVIYRVYETKPVYSVKSERYI